MEKTIIDQVADNLMSIQPLLTRTLSKTIRHISNISPGMIYVMGSLKRFGVLSMSDIGKCHSMPKPHVTVIVDKLIDAGYAERLNDPSDRRIINIQLTEAGFKEFEMLKSHISKGLKERLALLPASDMEELIISTQHVRNLLSTILTYDK